MDEQTPPIGATPRILDDCWSRIGVRGDHSCSELVRHVHCRNCPVHAAAADRLLERPLASDQLAAWTERYAEKPAERLSAPQSAFVFRLGPEWLALPTRTLESVATLRPVHTLPHRRGGAVLGIVNVGGELLVCVSLAHVLGTEGGAQVAARHGAYQRILVLRRGTSRFVARVDEVHGTQRYAPETLVRPPETLARASAPFTIAMLPWSERMVGFLDDERLFSALERSLA